MMRIAIMGTGGLGGYLGGRLAQAGHNVTFIARGQTLQALRTHGLQVHSHRGDFSLAQVYATDDPTQVGPVDLLLFCVKTYDAAAAIEMMRPLVGAQTAVIPVLNGIDHIAQLQAALGEAPVLGGLAMINAHQVEPGIVQHVADAVPQLEFGEWSGGISSRCQQLEELCANAGLHAVAVANIAERMWRKLITYCGVAVFAVQRGDKGRVWAPETVALVHDAMSEAVVVAQAQGVPLSATLADEIVKLFEGLPPHYKPSLLVDLERGRRLEVEATSGMVVRLGRQMGVSTPVNRFIYGCLKPYINGIQPT